ncbi:hypothetical protein EDB85DRAFT_2072801 [Lactarius pseudohatsudake]|nr:hypothetical protein EDB85DRAFT_2072801 [Lactarius pseudohatsudake]
MLNDTGRFRELPKWRGEFKAAWKKAEETPITMPMNKKYRPDVKRFVCTCPQFVISRFLICKHLVQLFHPVNPVFFLEVTRNWTVPFWSHPTLKPLVNSEDNIDSELDDRAATGDDMLNTAGIELDDSGESDNNQLVDIWEGREDGERKTYEEEMQGNISLIWDFCDALEYQVQFQDPRFLRTLEKEGARFFRLARNCLSREKRLNSSRAASPATWERSTTNALFFRSRPRCDI